MPTGSNDGETGGHDEGSATVEFILLAVLLLIPVAVSYTHLTLPTKA